MGPHYLCCGTCFLSHTFCVALFPAPAFCIVSMLLWVEVQYFWINNCYCKPMVFYCGVLIQEGRKQRDPQNHLVSSLWQSCEFLPPLLPLLSCGSWGWHCRTGTLSMLTELDTWPRMTQSAVFTMHLETIARLTPAFEFPTGRGSLCIFGAWEACIRISGFENAFLSFISMNFYFLLCSCSMCHSLSSLQNGKAKLMCTALLGFASRVASSLSSNLNNNKKVCVITSVSKEKKKKKKISFT